MIGVVPAGGLHVGGLSAAAAAVPASRHQASFGGLLWLGVIVIVVTMATLAVIILKRRFQAGMPDERTPFTLDELRGLHRRGELTDAEFETLKKAAISPWRGVGDGETTASPHNVLQQGPQR